MRKSQVTEPPPPVQNQEDSEAEAVAVPSEPSDNLEVTSLDNTTDQMCGTRRQSTAKPTLRRVGSLLPFSQEQYETAMALLHTKSDTHSTASPGFWSRIICCWQKKTLRQKRLLIMWIGVLVIVVMCLFPPWMNHWQKNSKSSYYSEG